jgi:hypothetical protein
VHVGCGEFEGVFEALGFDWAGSAELSGVWDVGDVFVLAGEHEVGFVFAVGLVLPVGCVCIVWICLVRLVAREAVEGVHVSRVMVWMRGRGMHRACATLLVLMRLATVMWVSVLLMR